VSLPEPPRLAELSRWWQARAASPGSASDVAKSFDAAVSDGLLDLPLPGGGRTAERFATLAWWGGTDLSLARLVEGHTDALAILAELGAPAPPAGTSSAVWAAEPPGVGVRAVGAPEGSWRLSGTKAWCSGASLCATALVTAAAPDGNRLFLVDLAGAGIERPEPGWRSPGMAASDTETVVLHAVPAEPVGPAGAYLNRPGFSFGGIGVAAVWWGGARATSRPLHDAAARGRAGAHALAHLGWIRAALGATSAYLSEAARRIDEDPQTPVESVALGVRATVADAAIGVLDRCGRALGPAPLATDAEHAQRVADLALYLRQHHAERDLARLGELDGAELW
jgi:alkylation response protein AidB-like acyl-CoA dehydrogenase